MEIWPDNVETVRCFIGLSTQWKFGVNGFTGLDYAVIPMVMEMNDVVDRKAVFSGLQMMEEEAIRLLHFLITVR